MIKKFACELENSEKTLFFEKFSDLCKNIGVDDMDHEIITMYGFPWLWNTYIYLEGKNIHEMASNHFNEYKEEILEIA